MRIRDQLPAAIAFAVLLASTAPVPADEPESPREAAARIAKLYRAEKWADAQTATRALMRDGDSRFAAATLGLLLRDSAMPSRASIVSDIWVMKFAPAVPHLVDLLDDADRGVRSSSASALGRIGDKSAIPFLSRCMKEASEGQRSDLRLALAHLGMPYLRYYIDGLSDRSPRPRWRASLALGELMDPRAVPALLKHFDSPFADESDIRRALSKLTAIPDTIEVGKTPNNDGTFQTQLRLRPTNEFRKDIEAWIATNRDAVERAIEPSSERWDFTKEPELPGLGVSFKMSANDIRCVLDMAKIKYEYHPARLSYMSESIEVVAQPGFKRAWGFHYVFKHNRLESVHFMADRRDRDLTDLNGLLKLKSDGTGSWTGLDGAIRIDELHGDAEKSGYTISLNYRPW